MKEDCAVYEHFMKMQRDGNKYGRVSGIFFYFSFGFDGMVVAFSFKIVQLSKILIQIFYLLHVFR